MFYPKMHSNFISNFFPQPTPNSWILVEVDYILDKSIFYQQP